MGSRLLSSKKLGARVSIVTLFVAQLAVGSLSFGFSPATAVAADTLLSDSFGTGSSNNEIVDWEEEGTDSDSHSLAQQPSGSGEDSASVDGGRFAKMRGGEWICRQVSAVGYNTLNLSYYWKEDTSAEDGESAIVEYFTGGTCDAPTGLTTLTSHELDDGNAGDTPLWSLNSIGLPGALSNSSFFIRFRNTADGPNDHLRIDAVVVTGEVIVASSSSSSSSSVVSSSSISSSSSSVSTSSSSSVESSSFSSESSSSSVSSVSSSSSSSFSSSSSSVGPCAPSDETLVAYWKFDEGFESLFAFDATTYENDGAITGATWNVSAPSVAFDDPYSMYFDGSNDVVTVTDTTDLLFDTDDTFSVSVWAKPTSFSGYQTIAHKIDDTGSARTGYLFTLNSGTPEVWLINDFSNNLYTVVPASAALTTGTWSHVGFTYDGSGDASGVRIFINGTDVTGVATQDTLGNASILHVQPFEIGYRSVAGAQAFAGYIDDVRVYAEALLAGDMSDISAGQCELDAVSSSSFSSVSSWSSSVSSGPTDIDSDGIPDTLVCTTVMTTVCTPVPDTCTPVPPVCIEEVCTPQPDSCISNPPSCIFVPSTTCSGPDNCPVTPNPDQADANENGTGNACEVSSASSTSSTDNGNSNGSYRGSRTNVLRSLIALFGGDGEQGDVPPGGFGGPGEEEFTEQEADVICRIRKALEEDATSAVRTWVAEQLAMKMPHSVEAIAEELKTGSICPLDIVRAKPQPKPIAFHVDALGFPVSSNDTWNKCIRGTATLADIRNNPDRDDDGFGNSCSRYHTQDVWRHPDLSTYFTWKRGQNMLLLPAGYALKQDVVVTQK